MKCNRIQLLSVAIVCFVLSLFFVMQVHSMDNIVVKEEPNGNKVAVSAGVGSYGGFITGVCTVDPLIIDLEGNGIDFLSASSKVKFDLDADGQVEFVTWIQSNDGFLVLDRNKNGIIDDGMELFGDQHGAKDGYRELQTFDENDDHLIDRNDVIYRQLMLWRDLNRNGTSEKSELESLEEIGIEALSLSSKYYFEAVPCGVIAGSSFIYSQDNSLMRLYEVYLKYNKKTSATDLQRKR